MPRGLVIIGSTLVLAAGAVIWLSAESSRDAGETTLELVRGERMARVGYSDVAPLAYSDPTEGLTGEGPEVARAVLARIGVDRVEGVLTPPDQLIPQLVERRFELIASGLEVTADRCAKIAFSQPIHAIGEAIVVQAGNPKRLHSYEDIAADADATIGVVTSSEQHRYANGAGIPAARIRVLSSSAAGVASVSSGAVDAFAADAHTVQRLVDQSTPGVVERARPFRGPRDKGAPIVTYIAFGFRRDDSALVRAFNGELDRFLGTPEHLELVRPFGVTSDDLPGDVDIEDVCRTSAAVAAANALP